MELVGRRILYTDESTITEQNIAKVVGKAYVEHLVNRNVIDYLYKYYKGKQPILQRTKQYRSDINNTIVENRANEIVSFKVGYLMGEPIQYVSRNGDDDGSSVAELNEYMYAEDKESKDKELSTWNHICGTAYRMILPDASEVDESPFEIYNLDPRNTFVVYSSGLGHKPMLGVTYVIKENYDIVMTAYSADTCYSLVGSQTFSITGVQGHALPEIPIVEYPLNEARLGAFEIVVPLLDCLNNIQSNRADGVEQFIQSLLVIKGMDINSEDFNALQTLGGIKVPADGDVKYLTQELNQTQTQTLTDYMYQTILTICGMPSRQTKDNGSNGIAVIYRDGWSDAETRAKNTELCFKRSEKLILKNVLHICNKFKSTDLKLSNIDIHFTRRNYENIQSKAQVFIMLISNPSIPDKFAYEFSGLFPDPEGAYRYHVEWNEEQATKNAELLKNSFSETSVIETSEEVVENE